MITITLKDGSIKTYEPGITVLEVANDISPGLAKNTMAGELNGEVVDIRQPINEDATLNLLKFEDEGGKHAFWHTGSHLLAQAVKRLYPQAKLAIGPAIDNGFYYDIDVDVIITPEIMEKIEKEMAKIVKEGLVISRYELSRNEALAKVNAEGEIYKAELIENLPEDAIISFYSQGEFSDLCAGPHIQNLSGIKAVKLLSLAGAYWRGDEKNKMLQRIYGITFPKKSELEAYLTRLEEAKKRDHRKLGKELDLFSLQEEGPGFPFFHPKGMVVRNELENFWREQHRQAGYDEIRTPVILNRVLWEQSGHWDHYQENMYFTKIDDLDFAVKPMNCPGSILVYKRKLHSYRDLPVRMAELGLVHRHELSGALHGLMRVRCFTQDDAHIFMLPTQIKDEIIGVIDLTDKFYRVFGFEYHVELSTKPEKAMGSDEIWELATDALRDALETRGMDYKVNEGDGAFYGPKIDFHLRDCLGRTWQCGTIQLDFQMPEKFDLAYVGEDGQKHRPVMIHRTIFGSIERFIGILIEHFAGALPTWLAPVQARVMTVTDRGLDFAGKLRDKFAAQNIRVEVDARNEKIGYKIREGQMDKVSYMLIIGDREVENGTVAVRKRGEGDKGAMAADEFMEMLLDEIRQKK